LMSLEEQPFPLGDILTHLIAQGQVGASIELWTLWMEALPEPPMDVIRTMCKQLILYEQYSEILSLLENKHRAVLFRCGSFLTCVMEAHVQLRQYAQAVAFAKTLETQQHIGVPTPRFHALAQKARMKIERRIQSAS
jgi:hypothetical protein